MERAGTRCRFCTSASRHDEAARPPRPSPWYFTTGEQNEFTGRPRQAGRRQQKAEEQARMTVPVADETGSARRHHQPSSRTRMSPFETNPPPLTRDDVTPALAPNSMRPDLNKSRSLSLSVSGLPNVPAFSCGRQRERSDRQARLLQCHVGQPVDWVEEATTAWCSEFSEAVALLDGQAGCGGRGRSDRQGKRFRFESSPHVTTRHPWAGRTEPVVIDHGREECARRTDAPGSADSNRP